MSSVTADFDFYPRQIVNGESIHLMDKSYGTGEVVSSLAWYIGPDATAAVGTYLGTDPFPVITPSSGTGTRYLKLRTTGSAGNTDDQVYPFYTVASASAKPTRTGTFDDISVFLYNSTDATVVNLRATTGCGFQYSNLSFTNSINKAGTATFTIINRGSATATEKGLLKAETYVAIISGQSVVWSGKILRSEQNVLTLYNNVSSASVWDIECESDISKMRLQSIEATSVGILSGSIGKIVSSLVTSTTGINWNGVNDLGLRSNEGPEITYNVTGADMYSQLTTLRSVIDFDMRTRLVYQRYSYYQFLTGYGNRFDLNYTTSPYIADEFIGRWVLVAGTSGVMSYGLCTDNTDTWIKTTTIANESSVPVGGGVILILGDPVLDIVSDLSQPTKQATFRMNTTLSSSYSSGYEFNDKTDKKLLATKVVAKGKTSSGETISSSIAAVTPWDSSNTCFENSTYISHRSEGTIVRIEDTEGAAGSTIYVEGWGFDVATGSSGDYVAVRHPITTGTFLGAQTNTKINTAVEGYEGEKRVTIFQINLYDFFDFYGSYVGGTLFIIKNAEFATKRAYLYVKDLTTLGYADGDSIYIDGETILTIEDGNDTEYGSYIKYVCDGTATHRSQTSELVGAHIPGSIVWKGYDESNPDADSPLGIHGEVLQTYTADQNVTLPSLSTYATMYLIANSYYYRKAEFWCMIYDFFKTDVRASSELTCASYLSVGDRIACLPKSTSTEIETEDGQLKNIWQIVSYTLDTTTMQVKVQLGDFERNVFTLLADKTAAINQTIT